MGRSYLAISWCFKAPKILEFWNFVWKFLIFSKKIKCAKQPKKQNKLNFYFSLSGVPNVRAGWVGSDVWDKVPNKYGFFYTFPYCTYVQAKVCKFHKIDILTRELLQLDLRSLLEGKWEVENFLQLFTKLLQRLQNFYSFTKLFQKIYSFAKLLQNFLQLDWVSKT